ncbi:hypothetical protein M8494_22000 [Serratia ureilytica]
MYSANYPHAWQHVKSSRSQRRAAKLIHALWAEARRKHYEQESRHLSGGLQGEWLQQFVPVDGFSFNVISNMAVAIGLAGHTRMSS